MTSHSTKVERHGLARLQMSAALAECMAMLKQQQAPAARAAKPVHLLARA